MNPWAPLPSWQGFAKGRENSHVLNEKELPQKQEAMATQVGLTRRPADSVGLLILSDHAGHAGRAVRGRLIFPGRRRAAVDHDLPG